jgi:hypothetical protein
VRARTEEDQEKEDDVFRPAESLHFQNGAEAYDGQSQQLRRFQAINLTKKDLPRVVFRFTTGG